MDDVTRQFHRQTFKFRWHFSTGTAFQDLFAEVMQNAWPKDFQKVKPYGKNGDKKCDGYLASQKAVFQCYGPQTMKEVVLIAKVKDDFAGAKEHWADAMKIWSFVHNDHHGLTANVTQLFQQFRAQNPTIELQEWAWPQAREQFDRLSPLAASDLFGYAPSAVSLMQMDFEELRPVVDQIAKQKPDPDTPPTAPSVRKLEKNALDEDAADFLRIGRRRVRLVEQYFEEHHNPLLGDQIAAALKRQYALLTDAGFNPNEVLLELQKFAGWDNSGTNTNNAAVLAVISYFFDRCDIFEDPEEEQTA